LNCSKCGKEILDEKSSFCAYCGIPIGSENKGSDFVTAAGIVAIIAAAFSITAGAIGVTYYQSYISYYSAYGYGTSGALGFLLFGGFAFVSSIFGFAGGILSLVRKRFKFAVLGTVLLVASSAFIFVAVWIYGYGYGEYILFSGIPTLALSLMSTLFLFKSKTAFSDYTAVTEPSEKSNSEGMSDEPSEAFDNEITPD
jgi:hypothetical protein